MGKGMKGISYRRGSQTSSGPGWDGQGLTEEHGDSTKTGPHKRQPKETEALHMTQYWVVARKQKQVANQCTHAHVYFLMLHD